MHLTDIRDSCSCGICVVIGGSSPALIKISDTSSRLYSAVMNSGGVTAAVLGEPLDIGGDPVVGGGGPLPVPFRRGEGIVYCEKSKAEISSLELVSMVV